MPNPLSLAVPERVLETWKLLVRRRRTWLVPALAVTVVGAAFALVRPTRWEASQALVVRDQASGGPARPGKFTTAEEMKSAQETLLELARSRGVLEGALLEVGPPRRSLSSGHYPAEVHVETLRERLKLIPPKGAEFGKTEVFYLKVLDSDRERAGQLVAAICRRLQARFEELRLSKAEGVSDELARAAGLARSDLDAATGALAKVERAVGPDLAELRTLNEFPTGESSLRRSITELEAEQRKELAAQSAHQELLAVLRKATVDPGELLASPSRLLESQPGLRRLKDGLVDAQLATARLLGSMSDEHPQVLAARAAERQIGTDLHRELAIAIKGLELESRLGAQRVAELDRQQQTKRARLVRLAGLRAQYANLATAVRHQTEILKQAQQNLSEARANQAAARQVHLLTLVDGPQTGSRPVGPGQASVVLASAVAGLLLGLGILLLSAGGLEGAPPAARNLAPAATATVPLRAVSQEPLTLKGALRRLHANDGLN